MRDSRVVHEHVETAELVSDAFRSGRDRLRVRDVERERAGVAGDRLGRRLATVEVARSDACTERVSCPGVPRVRRGRALPLLPCVGASLGARLAVVDAARWSAASRGEIPSLITPHGLSMGTSPVVVVTFSGWD